MTEVSFSDDLDARPIHRDNDAADAGETHSAASVPSDLKVVFANKFFFPNGGSEAVMFAEMALMRAQNVDVVEFSMNDDRNRYSKFKSYFVSKRSYRSPSRVGR